MAGGQERKLRRRIRSAANIKKITRAMELIAASRIVKAQQRARESRPYADQIGEVVRHLTALGAHENQALLTPRETVKTVALVPIAGDRGLCGGYNSSVLRAAEQREAELVADGKDVVRVAVGRKVISYYRFRERELAGEFSQFSENPHHENATEVSDFLVRMYSEHKVDRVELVYHRFHSMAVQRVVIAPFMPLGEEALESQLRESEFSALERADRSTESKRRREEQARRLTASYEFEPDPATILEELLERYAHIGFYAVLLDAAASELAARQRAMKSATENAAELIKRLAVSMNRARQDAITTEIIEIASGAEALNASDSRVVKDFFMEHPTEPFDHQDHVAYVVKASNK